MINFRAIFAWKAFKIIQKGMILWGAGQSVLRWMMNNIYVKTDPACNIKPDKEKSTDRIDGVMTLNMR